MRDLWNKYRRNFLTVLAGTALLAAAVAVLGVFAGAFIRLFGFSYRSVGSMVLFFLATALLSAPLELVSAVPKALFRIGKLPKKAAVLLYILLDAAGTALCMRMVDGAMDSVSANGLCILAVSLLLALIGAGDIGKNKT